MWFLLHNSYIVNSNFAVVENLSDNIRKAILSEAGSIKLTSIVITEGLYFRPAVEAK